MFAGVYSSIPVVFQETGQQTAFYRQCYGSIHKEGSGLSKNFDLVQEV